MLRLVLTALLLCGIVRAPVAAQTRIAFTGVNVVPMDRDRVLRDRTVLVEDGRIVAVARRLALPAGTRVIDGRGRWLSPGLADMHTHVQTRDDLEVYLAHGVTSVLHMGEASNVFAGRLREAANRGEIPAPHVYTALAIDGSPRFGHLVVTTPEQARAAALLARANGYTFIKVYNELSAEVFAALAAGARTHGLALTGHGVPAMGGLERQLQGGQLLVAHLEEYFYTHFFPPDADTGTRAPPDAAIANAVAMTRRRAAFVTADLVTYATIAEQWGRPAVAGAMLARPERRWLSPRYRLEWPRAGYDRREGSLADRTGFLARFVKALADAGVPLVAGTDAPTIPGIFIGDSLHRNLALLEAAGLTRYQALATATRHAGELMASAQNAAPSFGTVAPGQRANLMLTEANPLADLSTLRRPLGVMVGGNWHDRAALQTLLAEVAARYEAAR